MNDLLDRQLIFETEYKEYPFIRYLISKGAVLTMDMIVRYLYLDGSSDDPTPFAKWLSEVFPYVNWVDLSLFRKARDRKQIKLAEWMCSLPGGLGLISAYALLRKKCSAVICNTIVDDPDTSGRNCAACKQSFFG